MLRRIIIVFPAKELVATTLGDGEIQGLNDVRCEGKGTQQAVRLSNLDIQAYNIHLLEGFVCSGMSGPAISPFISGFGHRPS